MKSGPSVRWPPAGGSRSGTIVRASAAGGAQCRCRRAARTRRRGPLRSGRLPGPAAGVAPSAAIVADKWHQANRALDKLKVQWDGGETAKRSTRGLVEQAAKLAQEKPTDSLKTEGDVEGALKGAAKVLEARYEVPFVNHSALEPMNTTVAIKNGKVEIWSPTQMPGGGKTAVSKLLGI